MRFLLLALGLVSGVAGAADAGQAGAARLDYMLNCQGCHLPDGSGYPGKVPDLRRSLGPLLAVPGGREFVMRVPGAATAALDDERLARVFNWMLAEFAAAPAGIPAIEAAELARLRRAPLSDVGRARAPLAQAAGLPVTY